MLQAYFNLPSENEVRPEFRKSILNLETNYRTKDLREKSKIKESLLNQLIDRDQFQAVTSYCADPEAVQKITSEGTIYGCYFNFNDNQLSSVFI